MIILVNNVCTAVFHPSSVIFVYYRYVFLRHVVSAISTRITDVGNFSSFSAVLLCQNS